MTDDPMVRMRHLRRLGYCAPGVRAFCARHNLDLRRLAREGLPASEIERTGDAMASAAAEEARRDGQQ